MTPSGGVYHPRRNDHGIPVEIQHPTAPSPEETWKNPAAVAVFVPYGHVPSVLNGVIVSPVQRRAGPTDWAELVKDRRGENLPSLVSKHGEKPSAGAVILEPDGRVWLSEPTDHFGGY